MSSDLRSLSAAGAASVVVQAAALAAVLAYGRLLFIDYMHVLSAAMWFGGNVFMGIIFYRVVRAMPLGDQLDVAKRFLPFTLYFLPSISLTTVITGAALMARVGSYVPPGLKAAIYAGAALLLLLSLVGHLPASIYLYKGFRKGDYDELSMISRSLVNFRVSQAQLVLQVAMVSMMAYVVSSLIP